MALTKAVRILRRSEVYSFRFYVLVESKIGIERYAQQLDVIIKLQWDVVKLDELLIFGLTGVGKEDSDVGLWGRYL